MIASAEDEKEEVVVEEEEEEEEDILAFLFLSIYLTYRNTKIRFFESKSCGRQAEILARIIRRI
jgi:hypothetical protein